MKNCNTSKILKKFFTKSNLIQNPRIRISRKRYFLIIGIVMFCFLTSGLLLRLKGSISENHIYSDIEKRINITLKENSNVNIPGTDIKIEKTEDMFNKRVVLFSFFNPMLGYKTYGFSEYENIGNHRFRNTDFSWTGNRWDMRHINTKEGNYLILFGMNLPKQTLLLKYKSGSEERIEEFNGDYFLKKYRVTGHNIEFMEVQTNNP